MNPNYIQTKFYLLLAKCIKLIKLTTNTANSKINTIMKRQKPRSIQQPKVRYAKELFTRDTPYGHKVQRDRTKTIYRKAKYKPNLSDR